MKVVTKENLKSRLMINSPSKRMIELGKIVRYNFVMGMQKGMLNRISKYKHPYTFVPDDYSKRLLPPVIREMKESVQRCKRGR